MKQPSADRGHLTTEQRNAVSAAMDEMSVRESLETINAEDARVAGAVREAISAITRVVEATAQAMRHGGRLIYLGAGTSGRLGVLDASECPPTFFTEPGQVVGIIAGGDVALRTPVEGAEDDPQGAAAEFHRLKVGADDVVVGIAAGGITPYVLGALSLARARGGVTALVCCVSFESVRKLVDVAGAQPWARETPDHVIELLVGPEVVTGSTRMKAGTATKLCLNMITTATFVRLGKTWGNLMVDVRATNAKLVDRAARIVAGQCGLDRTAALDVLDRAGGRVKIALVMARLGVDAAEAERRLGAAEGRLRAVVGAPK
jgi:N-acetylmuramic acid 6-phosphate etherase